MSSRRVTGKVKFFSEDRGYGFIMPDANGPEVFVHVSDLSHPLSALAKDQRISYELVDNPRKGRGKKAANVELVSLE